MKDSQTRRDPDEAFATIDNRYTQPTLRRLIWASRLCVANRVAGQPGADWLAATFDGKAERRMLLALIRVWDGILVSSNKKLVLHTPECTCLSEHEHALITALCGLKKNCKSGYDAAMQSVLPPSAVRLLRAAVEELAGTLDVLQRQTRNLWLTGDMPAGPTGCERQLH